MLPTRYIFAYTQPSIGDRPFSGKGRSRKSKPDVRVKVINIHKFLSRFVEKPKRELQNNITNRVDPNLSIELALLKMARAIKANNT
jgi:hypothetical protein